MVVVTAKGFHSDGTSAPISIGDKVCIFLGCSLPMVVREFGGYCQLVGQIRTEEIMSGEAMAGFQSGECVIQKFDLH